MRTMRAGFAMRRMSGRRVASSLPGLPLLPVDSTGPSTPVLFLLAVLGLAPLGNHASSCSARIHFFGGAFSLMLRSLRLHANGQHYRAGLKAYPTCRIVRSGVKEPSMRPTVSFHLALALLTAGAAGQAYADIYSFVDGSGVTHFTNVPVDGRYRLLLATPPEERAARPENWLAKSAQFDHLIDRAARSQAV